MLVNSEHSPESLQFAACPVIRHGCSGLHTAKTLARSDLPISQMLSPAP
jgi:hypothetical protein